MLLINDADKKTIEEEVAKLKATGHAKDIPPCTLLNLKRAEGEVFVDMFTPCQSSGVALSISPNRDSRSIFSNHNLVFISTLGSIELAKFLESFPITIAPTLAGYLKKDPPEPNDRKIIDSYLGKMKTGYSRR